MLKLRIQFRICVLTWELPTEGPVMAELLIRASAQDAALLRRLYGLDGTPRAAAVPDRVVIDAHAAASTPDLGNAARRAGVPLLIDPQTFFLQDIQHSGHPWGRLPFGDHAVWTPADATPGRRETLIRESITYQIRHGATSIIAPYVHLDNASSGWIDTQAALWTGTRRYLDENAIQLPVTAVLATGWRLLHPVQGPKALAPVMAALNVLAPQEVALAASRVPAGVKPGERLMDLVMMVERLKSTFPVIAWQQGLLGTACIAAGAAGYETGIGWREKCDLPAAMSSHRRPPSGFGSRPVYVGALGRSVPAATVLALKRNRTLWPKLFCTDAACCPPAGAGMTGDARAHAVVARAAEVRQLTAMVRPVWRWRELEKRAVAAVELADKINQVAASSGISRVDTAAMDAVQQVAHQRRVDARSRRAA